MQRTELPKHGQVIADGPPFRNEAWDKPVGEGHVADCRSRWCFEAEKAPPGQISSRVLNCTTMSSSATMKDFTH